MTKSEIYLAWILPILVVIGLLTSKPAPAMEIKKADLIGAWAYVSTYNEFADNRRESFFGEKPVGIFILLANGHYSHIIMKPDLPRIKSRRIRESTLKESEAIAEGVLAHFGTYTVDEGAGEFTVTIRKSSFPNLDGVLQVRTVTKLDAENLSYINDISVADKGAKVVAVLRRIP
jgi:hypothetical protein